MIIGSTVEPRFSNSVNSKSPIFRSQTDSSSFDCHFMPTSLFRNPAISNYFSCPVGRNRGVRLYNPLSSEEAMKVKFFVLCDVIFLVRLQGKFDIDHSKSASYRQGRGWRDAVHERCPRPRLRRRPDAARRRAETGHQRCQTGSGSRSGRVHVHDMSAGQSARRVAAARALLQRHVLVHVDRN